MNTPKSAGSRTFSRAAQWIFQAGFVLAAALLAGCSSTGYDKSNVAATHLQTAAGSVRAEIRALDSTLAALSDLVNKPSGDLRVQFHTFSYSLDQLVSASKGASGTASRLAQKSAAYFAAWDKELLTVKDEELRKRSQARKAEVTIQNEITNRHYQEAQAVLAPQIAYLQDLRQALSADLTAAGLQAVAPNAARARDHASTAQTQLAQSAGELEALSASMASYVPPGAK